MKSKKAAEISWSDGVPPITVNNSADATTIDPPVFAGLELSIDSSPVPSPSPSATPKATVSVDITATPLATIGEGGMLQRYRRGWGL